MRNQVFVLVAAWALIPCPWSAVAANQMIDMSEAFRKAELSVVNVGVEATMETIPRLPNNSERISSGVPNNAGESRTASPSQREQVIQSGVCVNDNRTVLTILFKHPREDTKYWVYSRNHKEVAARVMAYDGATGGTLLALTEPLNDIQPIQMSQAAVGLGIPVGVVWSNTLTGVKIRQGITTSRAYWASEPQMELFDLDELVPWIANGGMVINSAGDLIGLVITNDPVDLSTGRDSQSRTSTCYGIPMETLSYLFKEQASSSYHVIHLGRLGIAIDEVEVDDQTQSCFVKNLSEDSPAALAGIKTADRILEVDGSSVQTTSDLIRLVRRKRAGEKVKIKVSRKDDGDTTKSSTHDFEIELKQVPLDNLANRFRNQFYAISDKGIAGNILVAPYAGADPKNAGTRLVIPKQHGTLPSEFQLQPSLVPLPRIEVERSNLEQSIRELSNQIEVLKSELSKQRK